MKSLHINEKLSDFDEIRYTNADLELGDSHMTKFSKFKTADGRGLKNRFWL